MLVNSIKNNQQFILFVINGLFITGIHLSIYYLLSKENTNLFINNMCGFIVAFVVNYFAQLKIFKAKTTGYTFIKYFGWQLVIQGINGVILNIFSQVHLILILICIQTYASFMLNKKWVFN